jgi:hypothetical protein
VLLAAVLAAVVAGGAWAVFLRSTNDGHPIWVGALEDTVKQPDSGAADAGVALVSQAGFNALGITTPWTPGQAGPDPAELKVLRNVAAAAERRGIRVLVSIYAYQSRYTPSTDNAQQQFASYAATLSRDLPSVRYFVVWNEPNLNGFWLPQFDASGQDVAAPAYTSLLAHTYDALKAVSPRIVVVGGSLAPRGADNPNAPRQTQSPTAFIRDMGKAYRASARTKPIMDLFAIHPYLNKSSLPPTENHPTGTTIGIADYDKIVRLLGDAFDGTAQPGSKLRIAYTEFGVQTKIPASAAAPYTNLQSPLGLDAVDEATQADYYRQALKLAYCQPNVTGILFFHTRDEADLNRWQSGLYYADGKPKSSLGPVKDASLKARKGKLGSCP